MQLTPRRFFVKFLALTFFMSTLVACSTNIKKADLPSDMNPELAVTQTEEMKNHAVRMQADVLAQEDFRDGEKYLEKAKDHLADDDKKEKILEDAAYAQAFFNRAIDNTQKTETDYSTVLKARSAAVKAQALEYKKTNKDIKDIDKDFRKETKDFSRSMSAEATAMFQRDYLEVEVKAVQERELGKAVDVVDRLEKKNAAKLAPESYNKAKEDILISRNIIEKSPRSPSLYRASVLNARKSTITLQEVMNVIAENGNKTPESAALKIVMQERKLENIEDRMALLGSTVMSQADRIAFQRAMDNVRSEFSSDEAEVYQQGDKLLIRLKKVNFPVGKSQIPNESKELLAKVNDIMKDLHPTQVEVQGHTDSTGSKKINEKLSEERAENVADYFKREGLNAEVATNGYGPNRPLADNGSQEGRAQNRRVDVLISTGSTELYSE